MKKAFPQWIKRRAPDPAMLKSMQAPENASMALKMGFKGAVAAPLVRSSFKADALYQAAGRMTHHPETETKGLIHAD